MLPVQGAQFPERSRRALFSLSFSRFSSPGAQKVLFAVLERSRPVAEVETSGRGELGLVPAFVDLEGCSAVCRDALGTHARPSLCGFRLAQKKKRYRDLFLLAAVVV